jgi:hypothetical protein
MALASNTSADPLPSDDDLRRPAGREAGLSAEPKDRGVNETSTGALPFALLVPDSVTIEAMKEARRGGLPRFASVEDLLDDLHAQD